MYVGESPKKWCVADLHVAPVSAPFVAQKRRSQELLWGSAHVDAHALPERFGLLGSSKTAGIQLLFRFAVGHSWVESEVII